MHAKELYEEGVRFPAIKLEDRGLRNRPIMAVLAANSRWPEELVGDLEAQVAACKRGAVGLSQTVEHYGKARFFDLVDDLCDASEAVMRAAIAKLPDGVYRAAEDFELDGEGVDSVRLEVSVTIDGDKAIIDFEGTGPQVPNATNCPFGISHALTYSAFRALAGAEVPVSGGLTLPIEVRLPPGTFVNPTFPAAVGARGMGIFRLLDLLYRALAECAPGQMFAGGEGGVYTMVFVPRDGGQGMLFDIYSGGWGARSNADGVDGVSPLLMGGVAKSMPAEVIEREFPVVVEGFGLVPDTAGPGEFRGCLSVYRQWRFQAPGIVQLRRNRLTAPPYGLNGGSPGRIGTLTMERDGKHVPLPDRVTIEVEVEPGDRIRYVLPSGGGHGHVHDRDIDAVVDDVREGKCSVEEAERVYGVSVDTRTWTGARPGR